MTMFLYMKRVLYQLISANVVLLGVLVIMPEVGFFLGFLKKKGLIEPCHHKLFRDDPLKLLF